MSRPQQRDARIASLRFLMKAGQIRADQATQLEAMLRRCRTDDEFKQVSQLVHATCRENKTNRWGKIASGDPLGFDEPDD